MSEEPTTLLDAIRYFSDPDNTLQEIIALRWPNGVCCPTCGRVDVSFVSNRRVWQCKEMHPKKQFSAKVGTIFEDSPLGLDKWFVAIWMIANCKNGVSSYELARAIGVTQKTAWFMLHRIRKAMETGSFMTGGDNNDEYEADETYFGGKAKFMHKDRKKRVITGGGVSGKTPVVGVLRRGTDKVPSQVAAKQEESTTAPIVQKMVRDNVPKSSILYTDSYVGYSALGSDYRHDFVDHTRRQYVKGHVWTNGMENFWSILKRAAKGTYVHLSPKHLNRYVQEGVFRYNKRKEADLARFKLMLANSIGRRLTYKDLVGYGA